MSILKAYTPIVVLFFSDLLLVPKIEICLEWFFGQNLLKTGIVVYYESRSKGKGSRSSKPRTLNGKHSHASLSSQLTAALAAAAAAAAAALA